MNTQTLGIGGALLQFTQRRIREFAGIFWFLLAFFLTLSLISYDSSDPSYNVVSEQSFHNWLGFTGAITADFLLQSIGLASIFIVLTFLGWGWRQFIRHGELFILLRTATLLLALLAASFLFSLIPFPSGWPISAGLGGAIGSLLEAQLPAGPIKLIGAAFMIVAFLALWGISSGINPREWKGINLLLGYVVFTIIRKITSLFRYSSRVTFDGYELPKISTLIRFLPFIGNKEEGEIQNPRPKKRRARHKTAKPEIQEHPRPEPKVSKRVQKTSKKEEQASLQLTRREGGYELPDISLMKPPPKSSRKHTLSDTALEQNARLLESVLHDFGVKGDIVGIRPGPVVTLYELEPAAGTKSSRVIGLADDIARSMSAISARISVIPGRNAMGIELPNSKRETVYFREMLEDGEFTQTDSDLPLALGKDIGGQPVVVDLAKMPHLLVAGTTGSGKSVAINTMIASLLYHHTPEECKFIMIDPKMLELSVYEGIPHLLCPVVTEPPKAVVALKWTTKEMENRYRLMANLGVRNVAGYNKRIRAAKTKGEELKRTVQIGFDPETGKPIYEDQPMDMNPLPFIVVVVDEMADLMLVAGKDIETSIQRLAQMARAAGIHIIMATQRPSVDVITGVVKANFPTRISFQVTSRIDSRTILGDQGAEQLLGMGDMLYMAGGGKVTRVHGPFVSDKEIEHLVSFIKTQGEPNYVEDVTIDPDEAGDLFDGGGEMDEETMLYNQAVNIVRTDNKASTSYIQRKLKIGYNRAARLIDRMEEEGVVSQANHVGKRELL
ncbi:MAG: DNA translocase FtsK 4TM domain-containing protein [Rickettsiales bacterium]|nr:DNA translocase FtsK 4TM domain-containing protein [Rickettsiales bacterium]